MKTSAWTAALFALIGCSGGTAHVEVAVGASSALEPAGADAPRLLVTVARVEVHVAGDGLDDARDGEDDGGWSTIFVGPAEVDLADAIGTDIVLGGAEIPAGKITQLRIILDGEAALVTGDVRQPVACPSCTQTGLKIVTHGTLTAEAGDTIDLTVLFDAAASLVSDDGGRLRLSPVLKLEATP